MPSLCATPRPIFHAGLLCNGVSQYDNLRTQEALRVRDSLGARRTRSGDGCIEREWSIIFEEASILMIGPHYLWDSSRSKCLEAQ